MARGASALNRTMTALQRLLEISAEALGTGALASLPETGGVARTRELQALLAARDGFLAFDGALFVLPASPGEGALSVARLNGGAWRDAYWHKCAGLCFFAADALGDLFAFRDNAVVRFASETGMTEPMAATLEDWAGLVLADPAGQAGWPFVRMWRSANGDLRPGWRLTGRNPFVLGGDFDLANLRTADLIDILAFRAPLATQIRELPEGAQIRMATPL